MNKPIVAFCRLVIDRPAQEVFQWLLQPSALKRLIPPWELVELVSVEGNPSLVGSQFVLRVKLGFFWHRLVIQNREFIEERSFTQVQYYGPFTYWKQTFTVDVISEGVCALEGKIEFIPRFFFLASYSLKRLNRILSWQLNRISQDLSVAKKGGISPRKILVSGASGMVASSLIPFLRCSGHLVFRLVRKQREIAEDTVYWDPTSAEIEKGEFEGFDLMIHLAGKNLTQERWTDRVKQTLFLSRCRDTWLLSQILLRLQSPPKQVIYASAVGFYGDRGEEILTEKSSSGKGFLAGLCKEWEAASGVVEEIGIKRVLARFGLILSPTQGILGHLLPFFRLGLGAILGSGKEQMSWIGLDDVVYGLYHLMGHDQIQGAVNFVAPYPETSRLFSKKVARAIKRPIFLRVNREIVSAVMGEMGRELLLTSAFVVPQKLIDSGYLFQWDRLERFLEENVF